MPRIRTIKPEFWSDEKLSPLGCYERLVFLGLICSADDAGRLLDNTKTIDAFVFPETEDSTKEAVETLWRLDRIRRGLTASGQRVIQIVNWESHQKVDKPNMKAALPEIDEYLEFTSIRVGFATDSRDSRDPYLHTNIPPTNDLHTDICGKDAALPTDHENSREQESKTADEPTAKSQRQSYPDQFEEFWKAYPLNASGRKRGKKESFQIWKKIPLEDRDGVLDAAKNYAKEQTEFIRDPERFLKKDWWRDYVEAPGAPRKTETQNGRAHTGNSHEFNDEA